MLAPTLLALSLLAGQTWTVDDDGPAQFHQIAEAIPQVAPGDVLLVAPGQYQPFVLDKALSILGPAFGPRPVVDGPIEFTADDGFAVARLELRGVTVFQVPGPARFDDCAMFGIEGHAPAVIATGCAQALISRSILRGGLLPDGNGAAGLRAVDSRVTLFAVDSRGGNGLSGPAARGPTNGGAGALALEGSFVLFASGLLRGGDAGGEGLPPACAFGAAGIGLVLEDSAASLRGLLDAVQPGFPGPLGCGGDVAPAILLNGSTVAVGAIAHGPIEQVGPGNQVIEPDPFEPFLRNAGPNAPGTPGNLELFAAEDALAYLLVSPSAEVVDSAGVEGLWLDPGQLLFAGGLVGHGLAEPAQCPYQVPPDPALIGMSFRVQCVLPGQAGAFDPTLMASSNAVDVIVRP